MTKGSTGCFSTCRRRAEEDPEWAKAFDAEGHHGLGSPVLGVATSPDAPRLETRMTTVRERRIKFRCASAYRYETEL
jgi:hypothetical protein